jgi:two-component system, NarL family, response regulator DevR
MLDPAVTQRVLERIRHPHEEPAELRSLTEQERRILEHVAEGLTNREIAAKLFLAEKTIKNYVSSLLAKLGLERRTQAAVLATRLLGEHH